MAGWPEGWFRRLGRICILPYQVGGTYLGTPYMCISIGLRREGRKIGRGVALGLGVGLDKLCYNGERVSGRSFGEFHMSSPEVVVTGDGEGELDGCLSGHPPTRSPSLSGLCGWPRLPSASGPGLGRETTDGIHPGWPWWMGWHASHFARVGVTGSADGDKRCQEGPRKVVARLGTARARSRGPSHGTRVVPGAWALCSTYSVHGNRVGCVYVCVW